MAKQVEVDPAAVEHSGRSLERKEPPAAGQLEYAPGTSLVANEPERIMSQILAASERGVSVESLSQLMDLYERVERRNAEKEFHRELAEFQAECPPITKGRHSKKATDRGAGFDFLYANLLDVDRIVKPRLTARGFSYSFDQSLADGKMMEVICTLRHRDGHHITGRCPVPMESGLPVGAQQKIGAAIQYAKRYALVSLLGIALDEPGDAHEMAISPPITDEQLATLRSLWAEVKPNMKRFLTHFQIEEVHELKQSQYPEAVRFLEGLRK